jgi:hypothetical protein
MSRLRANTFLLLSCVIGIVTAVQGAEPVVKPEQVIANHLNSIGTEQARGVKSRVTEGSAHFRILTGGSANMDGKAVLVSQGRKFQYMTKYPNTEYHGERIIFDGDRDSIAAATSHQSRSIFGEFLRTQDAPIREGLLGGVLSTSWPLLNLDDRKAKVTFEGVKKIDGQSLIDLHYKPKKNTDLDIHLYFDPETYHHVRTVYTMSQRAGIAQAGNPGIPVPGVGQTDASSAPISRDTSETVSARQSETRYRIDEKFSDFATVDGLTLPKRYVLSYSQELQDGRTNLWEWDVTTQMVNNNVELDPRNFEIR